jgi:hypothetical protein
MRIGELMGVETDVWQWGFRIRLSVERAGSPLKQFFVHHFATVSRRTAHQPVRIASRTKLMALNCNAVIHLYLHLEGKWRFLLP